MSWRNPVLARRHIRSWPATVLMAGAYGSLVLIAGAVLFIDPGGASSALFYAVVALVGGGLTVTAVRAGLVVRVDGVEVRDIRSRFIPWDAIDTFYVGGNWSFVPWSRLHMRLRSGEGLVAPYVASLGPIGPNLEQVAAELNGLRHGAT